jgi:predicted neuraminidase
MGQGRVAATAIANADAIVSPPLHGLRMSDPSAPNPVSRSPWPLAALVLGAAAALASVPSVPPAEFAPVPVDAGMARAAPARFESLALPAPHPACHAASLAARPGGGVLVAWFSGTREGAKDVEILFAEVSAEGELERSWKALDRGGLASLLGRSIRKLGNPSVAILPNGTVHLFVTSVSVGGWSGSAVNLLASRDGGEPGSWAARRLVLTPFFNLSTLVKAPPLALGDGSIEGWRGWGLPAYHEFTVTAGRWFRIDDRFRVVDGTSMPQPVEAMQPAVVALDGRRAVAALRDGLGGTGRVRWSVTTDGGATWEQAPARDLANPNSTVAMTALPDGSLLFAGNPVERGRAPLTLFRSRDSGATWTSVATVAASRTGRSEFSYPSLAVDELGTIWLAYTEQRKLIRLHRFTLAWLDEAERTGGGGR